MEFDFDFKILHFYSLMGGLVSCTGLRTNKVSLFKFSLTNAMETFFLFAYSILNWVPSAEHKSQICI